MIIGLSSTGIFTGRTCLSGMYHIVVLIDTDGLFAFLLNSIVDNTRYCNKERNFCCKTLSVCGFYDFFKFKCHMCCT